MPQPILPISATPAPFVIPKAGSDGKLAIGFIPNLSGTYQPLDSDLTDIAALAPANGTFIRRTGGVWVAAALVAGDIPDLSGTYLVDADIGASVAAFVHTHAAADIVSGVLANARVNFAAPAAIGNTTPAAGDFTTLNAVVNQNAITSILVRNTTNGITARSALTAETASAKVISLQAVSPLFTLVSGWANAGVLYTDLATMHLVSAVGPIAFTTNGTNPANAEKMRLDNNGNLVIGGTVAGYKLDVLVDTVTVGAAAIRIKNAHTASSSEFRAENNLGYSGRSFKLGSTYSPVKTLAPNDFGFYNSADAGNISFLNDYASGKILFAAGAASAAHLTINANGQETMSLTDAATATVTNVLTLAHETSGTPAASYGTGLAFQGEDTTTSNVDMGRLRTVWADPAHASRLSNLILSVYNIGVEVDVLTISPTATVFNEAGNDTDFRIEGDTDANLFTLDAGLDFIGIGVAVPGAKLHIVPHATDKIGLIVKAFSSGTTAALVDYQNSSGTTFGGVASSGQGTHIRRDGGTATTANVLTVGHNSSGTPAASFGGAIQFQLGSSTTPDQEAGRIRAIWTTATHASRVSNQIHSVYNVATEVDVLTLKPQNVTIAPASFDPASATNTFVNLNMTFSSTGGVSTNSNIGFQASLDVAVASDPGARTIKAFDALMRLTVGGAANYGGTLMGFHGEVYNDTANRTLTNAIGIDGVVTVGRSGSTITNGYGVRAQVDAGTGTTLTSGYGFYFKSQAGAGTYTNLYGLYLEAVAGAATLNYALYTNAGLVRFGGDVVLADVNLQFGTATGTKHGTSTAQKQSFWNATPIIQPASAAQALVATTAATQTTPWGFSTAAQADGIITLLNEIRNVLVNTGLMKGAA